jgi:hypothetical protein
VGVAPFLYTPADLRLFSPGRRSVASVLRGRALFCVLLNIAAEGLDVLPEAGCGVTPRQAKQYQHPQDQRAP